MTSTYSRVVKVFLKFYTVIHLIPILVSKRRMKRFRKQPVKSFLKFCKELGRSMLFISSFSIIAQALICHMRHFEKLPNGSKSSLNQKFYDNHSTLIKMKRSQNKKIVFLKIEEVL